MQNSLKLVLIFALGSVISLRYDPGFLRSIFDWFDFGASHIVAFSCGAFFLPCLRRLSLKITQRDDATDGGRSGNSIYGLDHGRLNLTLPTPMWMSMGFWNRIDDPSSKLSAHEHQIEGFFDGKGKSKTLAIASRKLLSEVLRTAGFSRGKGNDNDLSGERTTKALVDLGFGCGEQTVYLQNTSPIRDSDEEWWDEQPHVPIFDFYTGITLDKKQFHFAEKRVREMLDAEKARCHVQGREELSNRAEKIRLFCADASNPDNWNGSLKRRVHETAAAAEETWVLALDSIYHFSPSRWPILKYASSTLNASFMAFDLCLADNVSFTSCILLRILCTLMGAPWANFCTKSQYRDRLLEIGYTTVEMRDISQHVFEPLVAFLEEHDRRLRVIGYGLGSFHAAKWMFGWWARSSIVRGVIVVAKK